MKSILLAGMLAAIPVTAAAQSEVKTVEGDLPGEAEFEALQGLEDLADRDVVLLDLMLPKLEGWEVCRIDGIHFFYGLGGLQG